MKKNKGAILIILCVMLILCTGCNYGKSKNIHSGFHTFEELSIERNGEGYDIKEVWKIVPQDTSNAEKEQTITFIDNDKVEYEGEIYSYKYNGDRENYNVEIVFPNKETYSYTQMSTSGYGSGMINQYKNGQLILDAVQGYATKDENGIFKSEHPFIAFLFLVSGLVSLIWPRSAWYISYGWRYKNAEPSETAITFERIGGVIAIIIAFIIFLN